MAKIKINKKPTPPKEKIEEYKDFNNFIKGYKEFTSYRGMRFLYRNRRLYTLVIVIVVLILILLFEKLT